MLGNIILYIAGSGVLGLAWALWRVESCLDESWGGRHDE